MLVFQFTLSGLWNFVAAATKVFDNSRFYEIILWGISKKLSQPQLNYKLNTALNKLNLVAFDIQVDLDIGHFVLNRRQRCLQRIGS